MTITTCNVCQQTIDERNPQYNARTELNGSLPHGQAFTFEVVVLNFQFNCTNFHVCGKCLRAAAAKALKN